MGVNKSTLRTEDIEEVQTVSVFSQREIKKLYKRFKRLDKEEKGSIDIEDFNQIPELSMNPILPRIISIFDVNRNGQLNFKQFIQTLSNFHPNADKHDKIKLLFKVYDINNDGYITKDEIQKVLTMMVGKALTNEQILEIVEETLTEADVNGKGKLDFNDFENSIEKGGVGENMLSISFYPFDF
ncbi:calcium-binding EF-hand domain-containing protein [Tieghemostelium lacteum]|uniref:Calcium-binding EF-hand domain-containing protein n=1 Tax=Tieghemostelium lacteum TaxID=361077 RepID=A0A151Z908_TIELA|nr:calcium-binding EF-hand domain-containing protein [Tieghemostelium lacteum]|eukprot:KYQ90431.1 calcium-binding EF-hand domain-containing protein [Tieghemostelium lacteum]